MRSWPALLALASCALENDAELEPARAGEVALYRVEDGDSLSWIADHLGFPGGSRALARANHKQTDELRAGEGLRVPVAYLRAAGVDPYVDMKLLPFEEPLPADPLVECRSLSGRGTCVELGDAVVCVETTLPETTRMPNASDVAEIDFDALNCTEEPDGATDCAGSTGREIALYRGGTRSRVVTLPTHGPLQLEAHRVDLDGDRHDELVITSQISLWNHEGFAYWRAAIVGEHTVTQLDIEQWGDGSLVQAPDGTCDLLATSWDYGHLDPLGPEGMYFVGRRLAYDHGTLVPRGERIVRRMREYFHVDESAAIERRATPAAWLGAQSSRWRELPPPGDYRRGQITAAEPIPGGLVLVVGFPDGSSVRFDPNHDPDGNSTRPDDAIQRLATIHWAATGGRLPSAYIPSDPTRWIGAEVLVDRPLVDPDCEDCEHVYDPGRALWIAPR